MNGPNAELPIRPISDLVADPNFPQSALGQTVNVKGYIGVVAEVVKNSIKVRSAEGTSVSYNFHTLRKLYGPRVEPEPLPASASPTPAKTIASDSSEASEAPEAPPPPPRKIIENPNFDAPLVPIETLVQRSDFPACAFGAHIDLHNATGVVVELVNRSLKVRTPDGFTRSYNADGLRRLYAKS